MKIVWDADSRCWFVEDEYGFGVGRFDTLLAAEEWVIAGRPETADEAQARAVGPLLWKIAGGE